MDKQKQIEEIAKSMYDYAMGQLPLSTKSVLQLTNQSQKIMTILLGYAAVFYEAGYRKESDTARKLAKTIKSVIWEEEENETIRIKDLHGVIDDILQCHYGVTIED